MRHLIALLFAVSVAGCSPWSIGASPVPFPSSTPISGFTREREAPNDTPGGPIPMSLRRHPRSVPAASLTVIPVNDFPVTPVAETDFNTACFSPEQQAVDKGVSAGNPMTYTPGTCASATPTIYAFNLPRPVVTCGLQVSIANGEATLSIITFTGTDTNCSYYVAPNGTIYFIYNLQAAYWPHGFRASR